MFFRRKKNYVGRENSKIPSSTRFVQILRNAKLLIWIYFIKAISAYYLISNLVSRLFLPRAEGAVGGPTVSLCSGPSKFDALRTF